MLRQLGSNRFLLAMLALTSYAPHSLAQDVQLARGECRVLSDCQCGRWTCPNCQSREIAPPQSYSPTPTPEAAPSTDDSGINLDNGAFGAVPGAENVTGAQPNTPNANQDLSNLLAMSSSSGAGFGGSNSSSMLGGETPEFFGDFFGPEALNIQGSHRTQGEFPRSTMVTPGGRLGRQKLTENNSPIPQNRVFLNYSHFSNVPFTPGGVDVDRVTPGFEKTFLNGLASVEFRSPFGTSVGDTFGSSASGFFRPGIPTQTSQSQFGNLYVGVKGILLGTDHWVLTSGLSVIAPTADRSQQYNANGAVSGILNNGSVHLMPFIGGAIQHSSRHFSQWMVQVDVDATGNDVYAVNGGRQTLVGTLQQQNLIYVDLSTGYWLFRAPRFQRYGLTGIAWMNEFHLNQSVNNADTVEYFDSNSSILVNGGVGSFQNINALTGLSFELNRASRLGVGYAVPLGNGADNPFANEIRVTFNRYF